MKPNEPAQGLSQQWKKIATVGVDSASLAICDPTYAPTQRTVAMNGEDWNPWGDAGGVQFSCGFGDGGYDVWALVVDYGDEHHEGERIAQIVITMIDDEDLAQWRSNI